MTLCRRYTLPSIERRHLCTSWVILIYTLEGIGILIKYEHEVQILTLWPTYTTHVKDLRVNGHPDRWPAVPGPNHPSQSSYFCHTAKPFCFPHWNGWNEHTYPVCCGFVGSATLSYTKLGGDEWTLYLEWFVTHDWNKARDTGMLFFHMIRSCCFKSKSWSSYHIEALFCGSLAGKLWSYAVSMCVCGCSYLSTSSSQYILSDSDSMLRYWIVCLYRWGLRRDWNVKWITTWILKGIHKKHNRFHQISLMAPWLSHNSIHIPSFPLKKGKDWMIRIATRTTLRIPTSHQSSDQARLLEAEKTSCRDLCPDLKMGYI